MSATANNRSGSWISMRSGSIKSSSSAWSAPDLSSAVTIGGLLVALVSVSLAIGLVTPDNGPFQLIYRRVLLPSGLVKRQIETGRASSTPLCATPRSMVSGSAAVLDPDRILDNWLVLCRSGCCVGLGQSPFRVLSWVFSPPANWTFPGIRSGDMIERAVVAAMLFGDDRGGRFDRQAMVAAAARERSSLRRGSKAGPTGNPRILAFSGPGCDACAAQRVILHQLQTEATRDVDVQFLDAVEHANLARRFGVQIVPTTVVVASDGARHRDQHRNGFG